MVTGALVQAYETLAKLESRNDSNEIMGKYVDYHFEASEYEKKLIQVTTCKNRA